MSREHHVYIICWKDTKGYLRAPVKVGITSSIGGRLTTLQTGHWLELVIAFSFCFPNREIAQAIECAFHTVMQEHRLRGEWFNVAPAAALMLMCENVHAFLENTTDEEDREDCRELTGLNRARDLLESIRKEGGDVAGHC